MSEPDYIDGAAGKIATHDLGGEGDRTLIVCHATGFLGRVYRAMARELKDHLRVIAFDFRGHGDSDTPATEDGFDWAGMTDDLLRVVDHVVNNRGVDASAIHSFGHSMGGAALLGAERARPGTFASMMVFEPIVPPVDFTGDSPIEKAARGRLRTFPTFGAALERYAARPPLGLFRADVLYDYVHEGFTETADGVTLKCTPESEASTFSNAGAMLITHMADIDLPVVVAKSADGGLPAQLADTIAEALPNGSLRFFEHLTHFGPLQDPVTVAAAIVELIDS